MRPLGISIFPLALFGLLASLWHLGRPFSAWKSLFNLGASRLSLEVLLTLLFVGAALLYSHAWWSQRIGSRFTLGIVTSLLALAAIASSAMIYLIPTQPAWNSPWVPLSFFGTALLLGGSATAACAVWQGTEDPPGYALLGTIAGGAILIVAALWMLATLYSGATDEFEAGQLKAALGLLTSRYPIWLGLHLLLAGIVPIAFAALLWLGRGAAWTPSWIHPAVFLTICLGTAIGRRLMYLVAGSI